MKLSLFQIIAVIGAVGVPFTLVITNRRYVAASFERRLMSMRERLGVGPTTVLNADTEAVMNEIRQRCRRCTSKDMCERWLAGNEAGKNAFCPNAKLFEELKRTIDTTG